MINTEEKFQYDSFWEKTDSYILYALYKTSET
jgi:hypothetical protein